jgi:tetratricopeptide (TPR) repeat protein/glycosyltransferase involved in cell wall biosynthesis
VAKTSSPTAPSARHSASAAFGLAVRHHLAGELDAALAAYDAVITQCPEMAEAHNNAGAIRAERAERGDRLTALDQFRTAITLQPAYADAHHSIGLVLCHDGRHDESIPAFQRAVELSPDRASWWTDLANACAAEGRGKESLAAYDRALVLVPGDASATANRAVALRILRREAEGIAACRAALEIDPVHRDAANSLGVLLKERREFAESERVFREALERAPTQVPLRINLAVLLMEMTRIEEADAVAAALIADCPNEAEPYNVRAYCAFERGAWDESERLNRRALALQPDNRNAQWSLAVTTLLRGDFANGLPMFESRKRLLSILFEKREFGVPEWDGSPLDGRTIFVHAEQGLGDALQFVRYAPLLKARGAGRVIVECTSPIGDLMRGAPGVDAVVTTGDPMPSFDLHAYMMSLPLLCGTTLGTIPREIPYLEAPRRPVEDAIRSYRGFRVGLVWGGNPIHQRDLLRSIPLATLAPVLDVPGVTFFSLQKGAPLSQIAAPCGRNIVNLDAMIGDFGDTAAALEALDLLITVDTSVAHLAGALGTPVWMMVPHVPDWRWMLGRNDSPWYPSMRLFRQAAILEWSDVVGAIADSLSARLQDQTVSRRLAAPARRREIEISWPVGLTSGWGTYGLQLALALSRSNDAEPVLAAEPVLHGVSPLVERRVRTLRRGRAMRSDSVRLTALGNQFIAAADSVAPAGRNIGVVFFEDTAIDAAAIARAKSYDLMIAGSTWNAKMLALLGVARVRTVLQGVDPTVFHPGPRTGLTDGKFLVFSGGKLEYRKGQDIVVEAFRRFQQTHDDAVLVTAWHNHWPQTMAGIDAMGYVQGAPAVRDGRCEIAPWLASNGIPAHAILDLGQQTPQTMAQVLRDVDVAVFTNRCEGGTNLVAMEAMACGVPSIISANTGHLNLIGADNCFPLTHQPDIPVATPMYGGTLCWGESDPEEVVAQLEAAYDDRAAAAARGARGAALMVQLPWSVQTAALLAALTD